MVLTTIFVTRHGNRSNWTTDPSTGRITGAIRSPTGIPSDPALSASGAVQARELGELAHILKPPIVAVYASAFYRCLQTIAPLWEHLRPEGVPLICDRGLGEWFGRAPFEHYGPAALSTLRRLFPDVEERTNVWPPANGESLDELHDRLASALAALIAAFDAASTTDEPESLIICSHAASVIAMGRALTGNMPDDPTTADFDTFTCSVSRYDRRPRRGEKPELGVKGGEKKGQIPDWRGGKGVGGGWNCTVNASVEHLSDGGERNWHFSGDESFFDIGIGGPGAREEGESVPKL